MMAGLFLIFALELLAIYYTRRAIAIALLLAGLALTLLMFAHHATDILKINW